VSVREKGEQSKNHSKSQVHLALVQSETHKVRGSDRNECGQ